jgi:hypothetical protein
MFENKVLGRCECKKEVVTGEGRKLHNEVLYNLHPSSNIVRVIKSRSVRWIGCNTHGGSGKCIQNCGHKMSSEETTLET